MGSNHNDERSRSFTTPPRSRRRFSIWTVIAPAAAIILWISFFTALGGSCFFKECKDESKSDDAAAAASADKRNDLDKGARAKVKAGDSLGSIAAKFELTEDELKACNPLVDPQTLQPNTYLIVSAIDCEDADRAEAGANPDPLAGDTTAGADAAVDPAANGTAAADPSAKALDGGSEASAEQGDEG